MLRRAKRLQKKFDEFCASYNVPQLKLSQEEWRQIDYLLCITQPFFKWTSLLSQTKDISIHLVFGIYNRLFDHLEKSIRQLQRKKVHWKQLMLKALEAAKVKLSHYYGMTDQIPSDLYAIATILAPQHKLKFFSTKEWNDPDQDWQARYRSSLEKYLEPYYDRLQAPSGRESLARANASATAFSEIEREMANIPGDSQQSSMSTAQLDELTQYLESSKYLILF